MSLLFSPSSSLLVSRPPLCLNQLPCYGRGSSPSTSGCSAGQERKGKLGEGLLRFKSSEGRTGTIYRRGRVESFFFVRHIYTMAQGSDVPIASPDSETLRVGFVGAGQMAEALAKGLSTAGVLPMSSMFATDVNSERLQVFKGMGIETLPDSMELASKANVIILAVKPNNVKGLLQTLRGYLTPSHLLISIAAGVSLPSLQEWSGSSAHVVRVMPNTPCLVGEAASAMSVGRNVSDAEVAVVKRLFSAVGEVHVLEEKLMDAVTGLSGSGPAYVFMAVEALADGGVAAGLPRNIALALATQTVLGSAKMLRTSKRHPGELKDAVASPGGTTIAGIHELERGGYRASLMNAVVAAAKRSAEMSKS